METLNFNTDLKLQHIDLLATELDNLRLNQQLIDVILIDQDHNQYPANKNILAASSTYFYNNFVTPKNPPLDPECLDKFQLPFGVSSKSLEVILKFCYTGILEVSDVNIPFVEEVINASEILQFDLIEEYCSDLILSDLTPDNFLSHWQNAEKNNNEEKKHKVVKMMAENFAQVRQLVSFLDANVDCMKMILAQDELKTQTEDAVFETVLKWVDKDVDGRVKCLESLLETINWENLSNDFLESLDIKAPEIMDQSMYLMKRSYKETTRRFKFSQKKANEEVKKLEISSPASVVGRTTTNLNEAKIENICKQNGTEFNFSSNKKTSILHLDECRSELETLTKTLEQGLPNYDGRYVKRASEPRSIGIIKTVGNKKPSPGFIFGDFPENKMVPKTEPEHIDVRNKSSKSNSFELHRSKSNNNIFNSVSFPTSQGARPKSQSVREYKAPRNKNEKFQSPKSSNRHAFLSSKNNEKFQSTESLNRDLTPRNQHYNQRDVPTPRNKHDKFQPSRNFNQHEVQPSRNKYDNYKPNKTQVLPVRPDAEVQPTQNKTTHQQQNAKKENDKIQPTIQEIRVEYFKTKEEKGKSQSAIKKQENIFENFKVKEEKINSIFGTNNFSAIESLPTEIIMIKVTNENTEVFMIDTNGENTATQINDMKLPHQAAICCNKDKIYALGGCDLSGEVMRTVIIFDIKTRSWEVLDDMNVGRCGAGATISTTNDYLYVIGGRGDENQSLCLTECCNLKTMEWSDLLPMKIPRVKPAVCYYKDSIYVFGGDTVLPDHFKVSASLGEFASSEVYNLKSKQWVCLQTKLPIQRSLNAFVTTVMKGKIYSVRAFRDEEKWLLYQYDPRINFWREILVRDEKMQSWIGIGTINDEELCFVNVNGEIFKFKLSGQPIQVGNGDRKNVNYAVVLG